jgi:hypothetical protein
MSSKSNTAKNKKVSEASKAPANVATSCVAETTKSDSIGNNEDLNDGPVNKEEERDSSVPLRDDNKALKNANTNSVAPSHPTTTTIEAPPPPPPIVPPPTTTLASIDHPSSTTVGVLDEKLLQEQEVQHYNATFYAIIGDFYADRIPANTEAHLFEAVLLEFWKFLDSSVHRKVFQTICSYNGEQRQEQLKKCLTVDAWERANKYVLDFMKHHYNSTPGTLIPAIFRISDLPLLQHQRNRIQMGAPKSALAKPSQIPAQPVPSVVYNDTIYVPKDESVVPQVAPPSGKKKRKSISKLSSVDEDEDNDEKPKVKTRQPKMAGENRYLAGEPRDKDVMYGRGGGTNNHLGNILYLIEKLKLQPGYTFLATQKGKKVISQELVDRVHAYGGRFVAKDPETNRWYEVDDGVARRKASQTLREDKTPYDQAVKRQCLMRKLKEFQSGKRLSRSRETGDNGDDENHSDNGSTNLISPQEENATQMLLELGAKKENANSNEEAAV